ncbi:MAG: hypothetical protein ACLVL7_02145 [Anaerotruncus massiliensis (ex Togo et al. 2019)]
MSVYRSAAAAGLMPFDPHSLNTAVLSVLRRMEKSAFSALPDGRGARQPPLRRCAAVPRQLLLVKPAISPHPPAGGTPTRRGRRPHDMPPPRAVSFNKRGMEIFRRQQTTRILIPFAAQARGEKRGLRAVRFLEARATDLYSLNLPPSSPAPDMPEDYR